MGQYCSIRSLKNSCHVSRQDRGQCNAAWRFRNSPTAYCGLGISLVTISALVAKIEFLLQWASGSRTGIGLSLVSELAKSMGVAR